MTEEKKEETSSTPAEEVKKEEKSAPVETKKEKSTPADKEEKEVEVPAKFKKLVEEIEKMAVIDLAELVKILEKKFGVSAAAPVAIQVAGASPAGGQEGGEKSAFDIQLTGIGDKKIEVIKAVRDVMAKGLKESKDLVDAAEKEPQMIKENVKKDEAEEIKKKFEAAGAKVELK